MRGAPGSLGPPWPDPIVEVEGVSFDYGRDAVLEQVSLAARAGEFVGLLGPNGAGKSTLVRLVAGLVAPRAGT
ncbi:MAG TPA: ATP-binding cassette domain-containing protein, partial [Anaeromyxobacteraceae bacterium]|nr:ATP-binding cassette domain-containing protein [Anaeromyxobacteraceae bacterium]